MLYPREEKAEKKLVLACRNCPFYMDAKSHLVYQHNLKEKEECVASLARQKCFCIGGWQRLPLPRIPSQFTRFFIIVSFISLLVCMLMFGES